MMVVVVAVLCVFFVMHFVRPFMTQTSCVAFILVAAYQIVMLDAASFIGTVYLVVMMNIGVAIHPIPFPRPIGDKHFVPIPNKASGAPTPRVKRHAERDA